MRPYKIRPSQCKKCFRFGHWADTCTRQQVCVKCGVEGANHGTECTERTKCCLCGGAHRATDQTCPKWVKQIEVCKIRTEHQVSYGRAVEILNRKQQSKRAPNPVGSSWGPSLVNSESERVVRQTPPTWVPEKTSTTFSDSSDEENSNVAKGKNNKKRNRNSQYKPNKFSRRYFFR